MGGEVGNRENIVPGTFKEFQAVLGKGMRAMWKGKKLFAGNVSFLVELGILISSEINSLIDALAMEGKTPFLFAEEDSIIGCIAVADEVKESSKMAIRMFKQLGIKTIMLTGDNEITAKAIAAQVEINEVIAGVLPTEKEKKISSLIEQGRVVAMVGDGVNDAPALAAATVGIAIGAGTDIAIESADIVLMKSDLLDAFVAIKLSKSVMKNIKENLFWAFFYNIIGIPLASGVFYSILGWKLNQIGRASCRERV